MILLKTLLVVIAIIAIAFIGLGIRIWIKGRFPDTEVETNPHMKKMGIKCAKQEEWEAHCEHTGTDFGSCSSCCSSCGTH
jgi:uncharacterized protein YneF (UPF0154 family)